MKSPLIARTVVLWFGCTLFASTLANTDDVLRATWRPVSDGQVPGDALALARDGAGRGEFVCRVVTPEGQHLGRLSESTPEITQPNGRHL